MKSKLIPILLAVTLASCATSGKVEQKLSWKASADYEATGIPPEVGVYLYGGKTLLELPRSGYGITVKDKNGETIKPEIIGKYARFDKKLEWFTVEFNGKKATYNLIQKINENKLDESNYVTTKAYTSEPVVATSSKPNDAELDALIADSDRQLTYIQNELDRLKIEINNETTNFEPYYQRLALLKARLNETSSALVIVTFDYNKSNFEIDENTGKLLIIAASSAEKVIIRGRTDSIKPSTINSKVARKRAESARNYLVAHGISSKKIKILSLPSGDFVVPSVTDDTKAENRRVEIEITNSRFNELRNAVQQQPNTKV